MVLVGEGIFGMFSLYLIRGGILLGNTRVGGGPLLAGFQVI